MSDLLLPGDVEFRLVLRGKLRLPSGVVDRTAYVHQVVLTSVSCPLALAHQLQEVKVELLEPVPEGKGPKLKVT